jgi:glycosyltransferase involved in cell wall biosynthesis
MNISVCMAVYNGARFVGEQIASILPQLGPEDELVIVDDCSKDRSVAIIEALGDPRIKLLRNEHNRGVLKTFERALANSSGDLIFLCDQDDLWRGDKVQKFRDLFRERPDVSLALSDACMIDAEGNTTVRSCMGPRFRPGLVRNLVQSRFLGCAMVLRRSLLAYCLPFPEGTPQHDLWIGLVNQLVGRVGFIAEPLICYRRHSNTVTNGKHASLAQMLHWRFVLAKNLACVYVRGVVLRNASVSEVQ